MSVAVNIEAQADETAVSRERGSANGRCEDDSDAGGGASGCDDDEGVVRERSELADRSYAVAFGGGRVALVRDRATEWWQGWRSDGEYDEGDASQST